MMEDHNKAEDDVTREEEGRKRMEGHIEAIIDRLRCFTITIEEFSVDSQYLVFDNLNKLIQEYEGLENIRHLYDVPVPNQIFDYIDQGKNPDLFIKAALEGCLKANERTKGKIQALELFKDELSALLQEEFPAEFEEYKQKSSSTVQM
eukprot:TRINITY_DN7831_c0_g1_i1.p1 TRINITY_DN7831_c0_g1~~TRINITY_DN7831_c0_g1_i1.p1  ORF type:complete len:148 (-),score=30.93 TRINITY_DN7831_c0_g1_i1:46-489(-)